MSDKKVMDSAIRIWGADAFDRERIAEVDAAYEQVKDRYKSRKCPRCGHVENSIAWTTVAIYDMAQSVGLKDFIYDAYTIPLLESHPSLKGTIALLEDQPTGFGFADRADPQKADAVLAVAHALLLRVLGVIVERFETPGLDELVARAAEDYRYIWQAPSSEPATSPTAGQ